MKYSIFFFSDSLLSYLMYFPFYILNFFFACILLKLFCFLPLSFHTGVFNMCPVVEDHYIREKNILFACSPCCCWRPIYTVQLNSPILFLYLYGLEIYPGIDWIQLAVQCMERGSLGWLSSPAVHHDAVNILRTAGWTGQPKPWCKQIQHFLIAFS